MRSDINIQQYIKDWDPESVMGFFINYSKRELIMVKQVHFLQIHVFR